MLTNSYVAHRRVSVITKGLTYQICAGNRPEHEVDETIWPLIFWRCVDAIYQAASFIPFDGCRMTRRRVGTDFGYRIGDEHIMLLSGRCIYKDTISDGF
jgi:hypothetical protein